MARNLIGSRIRALRHARKLSQDGAAQLLGFKDRQTVSMIETGARRVTADELLLAAEKLGAPLEYFTDPFRLEGEGQFSWRQTGVPQERLDAYERKAGQWLGAYRTLAPQVGRQTRLLRPCLSLTRRSRYEDAMQAGERFADEFGLGPAPARRLAGVMEEELGILVLMVDADEGISGAACRLPELDAALIARREVAGRRHFGMAHELFHLLTWQAMPPKRVEGAELTDTDRVEQLANNFAAALLMPSAALERFGPWEGLSAQGLVRQLNRAASELGVTAPALSWRLAGLGQLAVETAQRDAQGLVAQQRRNGAGRGAAGPVLEALCRSLGGGLGAGRRVGAARGGIGRLADRRAAQPAGGARRCVRSRAVNGRRRPQRGRAGGHACRRKTFSSAVRYRYIVVFSTFLLD